MALKPNEALVSDVFAFSFLMVESPSSSLRIA